MIALAQTEADSFTISIQISKKYEAGLKRSYVKKVDDNCGLEQESTPQIETRLNSPLNHFRGENHFGGGVNQHSSPTDVFLNAYAFHTAPRPQHRCRGLF